MAVRQFEFVVGPETSTLPSIGTPSGDDDLLSLGYANAHYVQGKASEASITTIKAIAEADRTNGDIVLDRTNDNLYRFDSGSSATGDDNFVLTPDAGTGRWLRLTILNRANTFTDTTDSSSKDTGGAIFEGGVGIEKNLYVGANLTVDGDMTVSGTTTTINTATMDVEDPNITVNSGGTQATANSAVSGITVIMSDATDARLGYDSSSNSFFKCGLSGSESDIVTVGTSATITGTWTYSSGNGFILTEISPPGVAPSGSGRLYYSSVTSSLHETDENGVDREVSAYRGALGTNHIANPSGYFHLNGWVDSGTSVVTSYETDDAEIPREGVHPQALKFTVGSSGTDYARYRWKRGLADAGKGFLLSWAQNPGSTYASGDLKVEIYTNDDPDYLGSYTEVALDTDVSGDSSIADAAGLFTSAFTDPDTDPYYELRLVRVANGGGADDFVALSDIAVEPANGKVTLSPLTLTGTFTAHANRHYLVDTSGGAFTVTLPSGEEGARLRFSDVTDSWASNNLTLDGSGSETIDSDLTLVCDVQGVWVELFWDGTEWKSDDPIDPHSTNLTADVSFGQRIALEPGASEVLLANSGTLTPLTTTVLVEGNGGAVTLDGTTSIADGVYDGQVLILIGNDGTNTVTINNNSNTRMTGNVTLAEYDTIQFIWIEAKGEWLEMSRSDNS